ncbi:hybrid sensor histidine kinase/response regulator [Saccharobesus litoralis]|uniref:histidine kinase n=1 Tax=Saccharobesus litoralis TaxID=2172099 RepID=A0A2S0VVY2_9ALTE|nr:ATP-binding protein [Saccharobesus litoralis]AWB68355.1 hybrid sensor histidine kinase/response regulator [Saccharobesus litoralis]
MIKRSIQANAFLFAVVPTLLTALFVTLVLAVRMSAERDQLLASQAHNLAEAIAFASEGHLANNQKAQLSAKLKEIHANASLSIEKIAIYRPSGHLYVASKYEDISPVFNPIKLKNRMYQTDRRGEKLIISRSIMSFDSSKVLDDAWQDDTVTSPLAAPLGYVYVEINISSQMFYAHRSNLLAGILILLGTLFTSVLMRVLIKRIVDPVVSIVDTIKKIGAGNLNARVDIPVQYELNELKIGINMMASELQENNERLEEEIETATYDLQQNLHLVEEKNAQLDIARKDALEASKIKSQFLATMSHEIRTPLTAIMGFTKELSKIELQQPYNEYVNTINASADNLVAIVNDILDFSKIEAGKLELDSVAYDLQQTVEDVIKLVSPIAFGKNLSFIYESDRLPTAVIGDQHRIKQLITNLVSNAIKFTPKGHVAIRIGMLCTSSTQCEITIEVEDSGIGISHDKQAKLFTAFSQAESSTTRRFGGTGLGLAICQGLVKQMSGKLSLVSAEGKGSTFTLTIPITVTQKPQTFVDMPGLDRVLILDSESRSHTSYEKICQQVGATPTICNDISSWEEQVRSEQQYDLILIASDHDEESLELLPLQASFASKLAPDTPVMLVLPLLSRVAPENRGDLADWQCIEKPLTLIKLNSAWQKIQDTKRLTSPAIDGETKVESHIRMLAVDDNETNLKLLSAILREEKVDLVTCTSGIEACDICQQEVFDLILMDVQMPEMDGVDTTKHLRLQGLNQETPIIAFTAHAFKEERDMLLKQGMDDYLGKPIDIEKFNNLVNKWVRKTESDNISHKSISSNQSAGIDWSLSLKMAANKHQVAMEMLNMLVDTFAEMKQDIDAARYKHDTVELLRLIHKFHGSTCYTGVPKLKSLSFSLESQLKKGVLVNLNEQVDTLFAEMDKVAQELELIPVNH